MGNRDDIDGMSATNSSVLLSIIKLIDKYDLYGQVAYPKHHKQADVPEIYRLAAKTKVQITLFPIFLLISNNDWLMLKSYAGCFHKSSIHRAIWSHLD